MGKKIQTTGDFNMSIQFRQRSGGNTQKMKQLSGPIARRTFGDISGNRNCRTPHLAGQTVNFFSRKRRSEAIHILDQHDGFLPNAQISMRPPHFSPFTLHFSRLTFPSLPRTRHPPRRRPSCRHPRQHRRQDCRHSRPGPWHTSARTTCGWLRPRPGSWLRCRPCRRT